MALLLGDSLWTAHAGDCRAVLDREGDTCWSSRALAPSPDALLPGGPFAAEIAQLTQDHLCSDPNEARRVLACGGSMIAHRAETHSRVAATCGDGGGLQVSRALGDAARYAGVTAEPEVSGPVRLSQRDATLTLATDGVFDVLSNRQVAQTLRDTAPFADAGPKALLVKALDAGATDNLGVIVVYLSLPGDDE